MTITTDPEVLGWKRIISPAADPCADCLALTKPLYEGWREAAEPACKGCTCQAMPVWASTDTTKIAAREKARR
jgi:hypothetical protein